eukprot:8572102-Pyramimonas_sp.AAC.1
MAARLWFPPLHLRARPAGRPVSAPPLKRAPCRSLGRRQRVEYCRASRASPTALPRALLRAMVIWDWPDDRLVVARLR